MIKHIKSLSFLILLSQFFVAKAQAGTQTAASCSTSDVQAAINSATDGDIVIIPNGSCSWASGVSVTKQITLMGASAPTRSAGATDGVTITDQAGTADLLTVNTGSSFHTTIANLRFMPGSGTGNYLTVQGGGQVPLMHDVYFNLPNFQLQHAVQWFATGGVIWNTTFESTDNLGGACGTQVGSDSGSIVVKPNIPWDADSTLGTLDRNGTQNLYIEDSTFSNVGQAPDMDDNARVVIRHNQIVGSSGLTHGATSTYGGRQFEIYDNTFTYPNANRNLNRFFWGRAGTGVITGNSVDAINGQCYGTKNTFVFIVESATRSTSHGCCTGYMCFHQPGAGASSACNSTALSNSQTPSDSCQVSDPIYIWGNTGSGATGYSAYVGTNDGDLSCNTGNTTATFFQQNRDYFVDSGAKSGWTRYAYPHPLRQGGGTTPPPPAAPTGLKATVH